MDDLIPGLLMIAFRAGEAILDVYNREFDVSYKKEDQSPLTLADEHSNKIITDYLALPPFNRYPVLSEEGKDIPYDERKGWELFWLVDPLDGTKEFIKRNGEFTVNIALIKGFMPVIGVIYVPVKDIFYFGVDGLGSYKLDDSKIIRVYDKELRDQIKNEENPIDPPLFKGKNGWLEDIIKNSKRLVTKNPSPESMGSTITVVGSRSHGTKELDEFIKGLQRKYDEVKFTSIGSSLKFCLVAEGLADIYPRFGPTIEWDTAAGQAIVEGAGGMVVNMETKESLRYNKANLLSPWFVVGERDLLVQIF